MPEEARTPKVADPEITAINTLMDVLSELTSDAKSRVLSYIFGRLGVTQEGLAPNEIRPMKSPGVSAPVTDIRSFANEKKPLTAIDRTAVVAFYLSEVAPEQESRRSIGQEEVVRYFKQAGFPLPGSPSMALVHAKNAGFFELEGPGQYRLNAVGYNLVAHRMPKEGSDKAPQRRPRPNGLRPTPKKKMKALPAPRSPSANRTRK
jgi:hypothetical protein